MKALVLKGIGDISYDDVANPSIERTDILVKMQATTICGTDVRILRGKKSKGVRIPSIIGHEFSGEVTSTGEDVTDFEVGDRITVNPVLACGSCLYCLNGMENVCQNRKAIGYEYDGSFAELVRIPGAFIARKNVIKLPSHVPWAEGALAEPLACCINGQRKLNISLGDVVVIAGSGAIGMMHVMLAKASGAGTVIVSEPNEKRRNFALLCGADITVDPTTQNLQEVVKEQTNGYGADVVILAIGIPELVNTMLSVGRKGARVSMFAGFSTGDMPPIDVNLIHYNELTVVGSSALQRKDLITAIQLMGSNTIDVGKLITHTLPLEKFNEAIKLVETGEAVKVALTTS